MNRYATSLCVAVLLAAGCAGVDPKSGADPTPEKTAQAVAEGWTALLDQGKYAECWQETSAIFKKKVTEKQWMESMPAVRQPLGREISRKTLSTEFARSLPGVSQGFYVVVQFETAFENRKSSVETVSTVKDKDAKWRVISYRVR
jgi:PBP1b-binding outer membrane lipoprotein LpoB